jgi:hypothetical protein
LLKQASHAYVQSGQHVVSNLAWRAIDPAQENVADPLECDSAIWAIASDASLGNAEVACAHGEEAVLKELLVCDAGGLALFA